MTTLSKLSNHNVVWDEHLALDAEIPVVSRAACQGDVSLLRVTTPPARTPIPAEGVAVVRGENGGHTHSLHGTGFYDTSRPARVDDVTLGTLTVPEGGSVFLLHPEHGGLQVAPGTWRLGRQREQADEIRRVAD